MYKDKMKLWATFVLVCGLLAACFPASEQGKLGATVADSETLQPNPGESGPDAEDFLAGQDGEEDTTDYLHAAIQMYTVSAEDGAADTVYHYATGQKINVGSHLGRKLYLELGDFYGDITYNGARIYWGDSLIYATEEEITNDWQTCRVCRVNGAPVTYVLLMINNRPGADYWHILRMDEHTIRLSDNVLAGNDYIGGGRYFHNSVICEDLDGDGLVEVGGKDWTEFWADSMMYHPCYIYKLGTELLLDEALSERETRAAYDSLFIGLDDGVPVYNPNERQHEKPAEHVVYE